MPDGDGFDHTCPCRGTIWEATHPDGRMNERGEYLSVLAYLAIVAEQEARTKQ